MKKLPAFLLCCCISYIASAQGITIQPSTMDFHVAPGGVESQTITIFNGSSKKVSFQSYLGDWLRDSTGAHQYFRPDTLKHSCAGWVRLSKSLLDVEPGQSAQLVVQLQGPVDSAAFSRMKWAMLFVQTVDEQDQASKQSKKMETAIKEVMRIGVHIYQTPLTLNKKAAKAVSFKPIPTEKNTYELKMRNIGDLMLQCKSYVELTAVATGKTYKGEVVEFPVFPEGMRKVKLALPKEVPAGKYSALAILDMGEDVPMEAIEKVIEIK
jgi:hypothetical protein